MNQHDKPIVRGAAGMYALEKADAKPIQTDPNGSYTGRAKDPYEKPIQDADDL